MNLAPKVKGDRRARLHHTPWEVPLPSDQADMAPPTPVTCGARGCAYNTPMGADMAAMLEFLRLHTIQAHSEASQPVAPGPRPTTKVDKRPRPEIQEDMSEHDWRFFLSEWKDYTRATGITNQNLLDELWSCMSPDLRRLAFDQGGKDDLDSEEKMLSRIRGLAVSVLHAAVHTVSLHEAQQASTESTKAFSARVRGIATNCDLSKTCVCKKEVSFLDETVYHVVLAGLYDRDMQERALSAAILKTIKDISSLVEFCSAEESGRKSAPSVNAIRSSYQLGKSTARAGQGSTPVVPVTSSRCDYCGGTPHSSNSRAVREKECRAFSMTCRKCSKIGHLASCCKSKKVVSGSQASGAKNAAVEKVEESGTVETFAFCSITTIPTCNRFEPLTQLNPSEWPPLPQAPATKNIIKASPPIRHVQLQPAPKRRKPQAAQQIQFPVEVHPDLPLPGHTIYPNTEVAEILSRGEKAIVRIPMCHMEYCKGQDGTWAFRETGPLASPQLQVRLELHTDTYDSLSLPLPTRAAGQRETGVEQAGVADTGAQMDICSVSTARAMGWDITSLLPVKARVFGASKDAELKILGGIFLDVRPPSPTNTQVLSTVRLFYVASNVTKTYLSLGTLKALHVVEEEFPRVPPLVEIAVSSDVEVSIPKCENSGVVLPGEKPCSCPKRTLPPTQSPELPCNPTEENLPLLKQFLLDRYASSSFNVCEHQSLPMLQNSPPIELHVDPNATPVAVHRPAVVPLHWKEAVLEGLLRDIRLGVIERVPENTPARWQHRMHITAKHNGEPRRTIDYQTINSVSPRQTHHTPTPWHLVSSIPEGMYKSCFDAFHGYHSLRLATEEDREATTFITEFGRFRYITLPQGFVSAGDAYTDRMMRLLSHIERQRRCIDDTLLYDKTIKEAFFRACEFLDTCGNNGVILNPKKFIFSEREVDFLGFTVTDTGVKPTQNFMDSILNFPSPANLTDVRSWFGAIAQISYTFAASPVMLPFKHLLSSKNSFTWSAELEQAFIASKEEVVRQCELGVRSFNPDLPTALATDWCKTGMGYWLTQKRCSCPSKKPGCCHTGWQTVYVGSKFCSGAESRYHPICGEAAAAAWAVQKCRFFLLGHPNFTLCLDHAPLIKIFSPTTELGDIPNPRLYNQKQKLLPYRFTPLYIPGKAHVTPDCYSRRSDFPSQPHATDSSKIDLLDIGNVRPDYSHSLGPPDWVSQTTGLLSFISSHPTETSSALEGMEASQTEQLLGESGKYCVEMFHADDMESAGYQIAGMQQQEPVRVVTWARLQEAVRVSPQCQALLHLLAAGQVENRADWPEHLLQYYPHRQLLVVVDGVILCGERPLIPPDLRGEVVQHLHAAHQGVTKMLSRATQTVFWPGMKADITAHREQCHGCVLRSPSNPAQPPTEPTQPFFPFSHVVGDFFTADATYLALADRYSNWLSIFKLKSDDSNHVMEALRQYFSRWGVPVNFSSDGASVFTSTAMHGFMDRWGVEHRVSSAYYPRSNKRAEVAVKSAKRLVMDNLGPKGSLDTDRFARALLSHRNCPDSESGLSPAQIIFGRELRDHLPSLVSKYQPRQEWRMEADLRARAMAKRHGKMEKWLQHGSRSLPPLAQGATVVVQDQQTNNGKAGRWTKSGEVIEVLPHNSYLVKIHGSRAVTKRNRQFLRQITPFKPVIPVSEEEMRSSRVMTRARTEARDQSVLSASPATVISKSQSAKVHDRKFTSNSAAAAAHRKMPVAPPGQNLIDELKKREQRSQAKVQ